MAILYVDIDNISGGASDANSYAQAQNLATPWLTMEAAMSKLLAGDKLEARLGTYVFGRSTSGTQIVNGTAGNHTTITNYADEQVTIKRNTATANLCIFELHASSRSYKYITIEASAPGKILLDMEGQARGHGIRGTSAFASEENHHLTFINLEITNCQFNGMLCTVVDNLTVQGCNSHHNGTGNQEHGFYLSGKDLLVEDNLAHFNSGWGIQVYNLARTGVRVWRNRVFGNLQGGIVVVGAVAPEIINNEVFGNTVGNGLGPVVGITVYGVQNPAIYHNTVHGNQEGIWIGGVSGVTGAQVANNLSGGNQTNDLKVFANSSGAVLHSNRTSKTLVDLGSNTTKTNNAANLVVADTWLSPLDATLSNRNYALKEGSLAIDPPGIQSVGVPTDKGGNPRVGEAVDQGAHEYGSSPTIDSQTHVHNPSYTVEIANLTALTGISIIPGTNALDNVVVTAGAGASLFIAAPVGTADLDG